MEVERCAKERREALARGSGEGLDFVPMAWLLSRRLGVW